MDQQGKVSQRQRTEVVPRPYNPKLHATGIQNERASNEHSFYHAGLVYNLK